MSTVLINGIGGHLGARLARRLSERPGLALLGLSRREPVAPLGRAEWLEAQLSGQQLAELLVAERVSTVIHLDFAGADGPAADREAAVRQNVLGTMELFGACAAAGVGQVLLRSHSWIYGASPLNPTMMGEARPPARDGLSGLLRDYAEVEQFVAEFAPRHPNLRVATLRCAPLVGPWSPLMEYLRQPRPPTQLGFDPTMQLLHIDDAAAAFALAATQPCAGAYNLAADDTLCLSQAIGLAGHPLWPAPEGARDRAAAPRPWPFDQSFLRHGCLVDTRRAKDELGWSPAHSAAGMLRAAQHADLPPDRAASEAALRAFLSRRR